MGGIPAHGRGLELGDAEGASQPKPFCDCATALEVGVSLQLCPTVAWGHAKARAGARAVPGLHLLLLQEGNHGQGQQGLPRALAQSTNKPVGIYGGGADVTKPDPAPPAPEDRPRGNNLLVFFDTKTSGFCQDKIWCVWGSARAGQGLCISPADRTFPPRDSS